MLISTAALVRHARDKGYAVPAVNVFDDVSMRAVVAAAETAAAPMIVQISSRTAVSFGVGLVTAMFTTATRESRVPVALHLDHCPDRELLDDVIAAGWSSVLF
ncbi:MAG: class II fructose-bisphosphate aldolase, partial [Rhodococcus sp. (in: high G+C Gram-positive bacteria)]